MYCVKCKKRTDTTNERVTTTTKKKTKKKQTYETRGMRNMWNN